MAKVLVFALVSALYPTLVALAILMLARPQPVKLFAGFLNLAPACDKCGLSYDRLDQGDGPAVFIILIAGFIVWAYTLLLPMLATTGAVPMAFATEGPFGIDALKPQHLFGLGRQVQIAVDGARGAAGEEERRRRGVGLARREGVELELVLQVALGDGRLAGHPGADERAQRAESGRERPERRRDVAGAAGGVVQQPAKEPSAIARGRHLPRVPRRGGRSGRCEGAVGGQPHA